MELFIYMALAVCLGVSAIVLVSGDLAFISHLNRSARYILAFFLSFGVLGFTLKMIAIGLLQQAPVMETAVDLSSKTQTYQKAENVPPRGLTYPARGRVWRSLDNRFEGQDSAKVAFGKSLFFDERLSATGDISCASCHDISTGGDDGHSVSSGIEGKKGGRNAPSVINAAFMNKLFWDGRARSLEDQAAGPLINPVEMNMSSLDQVVEIIASDASYVATYRKIYGSDVAFEGIADSIASFERTLISIDSPYDRFVRGDKSAMTPQQVKGMMLFDEIGCRRCHMDPTFSVAGLENKSPFMRFPVFDDSPYLKPHNLQADKGRQSHGIWRVPSLRNVEYTAPYFHNGSVDNLHEAVRVMATAQLGLEISKKDQPDIHIAFNEQGAKVRRQRTSLSESEIDQLVAFLKALSGSPLNVLEVKKDVFVSSATE